MPKTHHATRKFRLECGCLRDYPGMAAGKRHSVLCTSCGKASATLFAYPDKCCGAEAMVAQGSRSTRVSCTNEAGNSECGAGVHYDEYASARFTVTVSLKRGNWGNTGRA